MRDLIVLASWKVNPESLVSNDIEEKNQSPKPWPIYTVYGVILTTILGGSTVTAWWIASVYGANFYERFMVAWIVVTVLNFLDLLIIDLLICTWLYPQWIKLEGIELLHQAWTNIRARFMSLSIAVPFAAIAASLTLMVRP